MKKLIILMCTIFSISTFAGRYQGGYIDGLWFPFYRNTPAEKKCLEFLDQEKTEPDGCTDMGYISFKGDVTIIGVAEISTEESGKKLLFKLSDFRIVDEEGYTYTPAEYPSERKEENGKYFPVFIAVREDFMENLKNKNLKFKYTGKTWEEDYYTDGVNYVLSSRFKNDILDKEDILLPEYVSKYSKKKIKFSGVEKMKLDVEVTASYYDTIDNHLCLDFTGNLEIC